VRVSERSGLRRRGSRPHTQWSGWNPSDYSRHLFKIL